MKKAVALFLTAVLMAGTALPLGLTVSAANAAPTVIPAIRDWTGSSGSFTPNANTKLIDVSDSLSVSKVAGFFKEMLGLELGIGLTSSGSNEIVFKKDTSLLSTVGEEGYTLTATASKIEIKAPTDTGLLYGGITVVQSVSADGAFPCGSAVDYPEYEIRSGMLDVGRAWIPLDYVEEITRYMAYFKMNEMHLHINDDGSNNYSGFRLESDVKGLSSEDGYYTKDEYRAYQKKMLEYGVTVITEIDTPFHSRCYSKAENPPPYLPDNNRCLDISKEETVTFVKNLLAEYMTGDDPVFVNKVVHIGTDEYPREYAEQMRAYTNTLIEYVNSLGYTPRFWGGLGPNGFQGTTPMSEEAQMNFWDIGISGVDETLASNYDIINTVNNTLYVVPTTNYNFPDYFDLSNLYTKWQVNYFDTAGTYKMDADDERLLGACFALWNDLHTTYHGVTRFDIFDRLRGMVCLVAEKTWLGQETKNISATDFVARYEKLSLRAGDADPGRHSVSEEGLSVDFEGTVPEYVNLNGGTVKDGTFVLDGSSYLSLTPDAIGFPNTLEFDIYLEEATSEPIFAGDGVEILADADGNGSFGFKTEVYTFTYDYRLPIGEKTKIRLSSDLTTTTLTVNNTLCYSPKNALNLNGTKLTTLTAPLSQIGKGVKGYIDNIKVLPEAADLDLLLANRNIALGAKATASSLEVSDGRFTADLAVDGIDTKDSRLSFGRDTDEQWLLLDLGDTYSVSKFEISFNEHAPSYKIQVSEDGSNFETVYTLTGGENGTTVTDTISLGKTVNARYIKYVQLERWEHESWGYYSGGIREFRAYSFDEAPYNALIAQGEEFISTHDGSDSRYANVVSCTNALKDYLAQDRIFIGNAQVLYDDLEKALNASADGNLVYGNSYTTSIAANGSYPDESGNDLTDGVIITHEDNQTESPYNDVRWVGFNVGTARSLDVVIPLGDGKTLYDLGKVVVNIGGDKLGAGVTEPDVNVYYTADGVSYKKFGSYKRTGEDKYAFNVVIEPEASVKAIGIKVNASLVNCSGKNLVWLGEVAAYEGDPAPEPIPEVKYILGDVNNDTKVDSVDYLLVKRSCFNTYTLSNEETLRANVNKDTKVDSIDYVLIKRIAFGTYTATDANATVADSDALLPEKDSYNILFIGNSATYVNDIPATLASLCAEKGITINQTQMVTGGNTLALHAADSAVLAEIAKGYDAVFLQENGNSMTSEEAREESLAAISTLSTAVHSSGAKLYFYVRPPYGYELSGYDTIAQCELFDDHFNLAAEQYDASCVYVNRAFAYVRTNLDYYLWGSDNAHTNTYGAYLAVCTFYATLFGDSATNLGVAYGISAEDAAELQQAADKIAFDGVIAWES